MRCRDREEAGRLLASQLNRYAGRKDVLVLGLPRGGVPVGFEVAQERQAPLDVFVVRKLGFPGQKELAMGALASGGVRILNEEVISGLHVPESVIETVAQEEKEELKRREDMYRDGVPAAPVEKRIVILVDDGLATGSTMRAAVAALRRRNAGWIV